MSNEGNKDKTLGDFIEQRYWGENGVFTGTAANALGWETRRQREEANRRAREEEAKRGRKRNRQADSITDNKVICTELVRQGLMTRADLVLGATYFQERLSERHMRGYHAWAIMAVRGMRKSKVQTSFWRVLAQARADAIAAEYGDARRGHIVKCAVLHGFNSLCWIMSGIAEKPEWEQLYLGDPAPDHRDFTETA